MIGQIQQCNVLLQNRGPEQLLDTRGVHTEVGTIVYLVLALKFLGGCTVHRKTVRLASDWLFKDIYQKPHCRLNNIESLQ